MDRFNLLSFRPSAEPGARYRLLTAGCIGCLIGLSARPDDPQPLVSSRSLRHDLAEATGNPNKMNIQRRRIWMNPRKTKKSYMTHSLSKTGTQGLRIVVRTNCDMAWPRLYQGDHGRNDDLVTNY
jgi:hypothetical protein